jgi:hypothetical protein
MHYAQPYLLHFFTVTGLAKYANTSKSTILTMIYSGVPGAFDSNAGSRTRSEC